MNSDDSWSTCPRCVNKAETVKDKERAALAKAYGKVDADEYVRRRTEIEQPVKVKETLREKYSIGITVGDLEFHVTYAAHCAVCKFEYTFAHRADVKVTQ